MNALLFWPLGALSEMLGHPFMRHALLAGGAAALGSGAIGYIAFLRGQIFTADALSHAAFTGALAALVLGIDLRLGLYAGTLAVALGLGALDPRGHADDVTIGSLFAWILGLGVLFLALYAGTNNASNGAAGPAILFGSIFGLSAHQAWFATAGAMVALLVLLAIIRPLLFASLDATIATTRGVPVRALGLLFLALMGAIVAVETQVIGALLALGLLAAPPFAAQRLVARPFAALLLSAALALAAVWGGLAIAYAVPRLPPSFAIIALAAAIDLAALLPTALRRWRRDHGTSVIRHAP
jgi:zinc/manganese transport system permease protein